MVFKSEYQYSVSPYTLSLKKNCFSGPGGIFLSLIFFFCRRIKAENILALVLEKKEFIRILFVPV